MGIKLKENQNQSEEKVSENLDDLSLTVKEAAKHIGESPHVIRNWMRELKNHIPTSKGENGYHQFGKEAIEQLLIIQQLTREHGYSLRQVEHYLATGGEFKKPEPVTNASEDIMNKLDAITQKLEEQQEFNKILVQKLNEQQQSNDRYKEYIEQSLNQRDQRLLETLEESRAARQEAAAANEERTNEQEKKKDSWWSRLFGSD